MSSRELCRSPRSPWQVGMAKEDRAAKGGEGLRGCGNRYPAQMGLLFQRTAPALSAASISKIDTKPAAGQRKYGSYKWYSRRKLSAVAYRPIVRRPNLANFHSPIATPRSTMAMTAAYQGYPQPA